MNMPKQSSQKIIAFYPKLSRELGDIDSAIYYQQMYFWSTRGERPDGFIYKTKDEIEEETTIRRFAQDRIRKNLVKLGWLEVKNIKVKGAPTLHYKCLKDIQISFVGKVRNQLMEKQQTNFSEKQQTNFSEKQQTNLSSIYIDNNIDNNIDNEQGASKNKSMLKESFTKFWTAYPKKQSKAKAEEKWYKKNFLPELDKILVFIEEAKKTDRWMKGYVKDPVTFLNNQSWYDDLAGYYDKPSTPTGIYKNKDNKTDYNKKMIIKAT